MNGKGKPLDRIRGTYVLNENGSPHQARTLSSVARDGTRALAHAEQFSTIGLHTQALSSYLKAMYTHHSERSMSTGHSRSPGALCILLASVLLPDY